MLLLLKQLLKISCNNLFLIETIKCDLILEHEPKKVNLLYEVLVTAYSGSRHCLHCMIRDTSSAIESLWFCGLLLKKQLLNFRSNAGAKLSENESTETFASHCKNVVFDLYLFWFCRNPEEFPIRCK